MDFWSLGNVKTFGVQSNATPVWEYELLPFSAHTNEVNTPHQFQTVAFSRVAALIKKRWLCSGEFLMKQKGFDHGAFPGDEVM